MKHYTMTIFLGSAMLKHESPTMFGIINALRDIALKVPEYGEALNLEEMDKYIEDLVLLKNSVEPMCISNASPFIRIRYEERMGEADCPPTLPDCNTEKEVPLWQK